jgi:hypothetical protein
MLDVATQTLPVELERAADRFDAQQACAAPTH